VEYLQLGCACLIGLVFVVSAVSKARDLDGFAASVPGLLGRVDGRIVRPLAMLVLVLEALVPVLLAVPAARRAGFGLACLLLAAFTVAIAGAVRRRRRTTCRCFGASNAPLGRRHLVRNATLLAAALPGALSPGDGVPPPAGLVIAAAAGAVGAVLIVSFDDIVDLFAGSS